MIKRQLSIFLFVGVTGVLVDYTVYEGLTWAIGISPVIAKAISFIAGAVFAYFANRAWTFSSSDLPHSRFYRFAGLYLGTLSVNVAVNTLVLALASELPLHVQGAFLAATGTSTVLNFVGMKYFVFALEK